MQKIIEDILCKTILIKYNFYIYNILYNNNNKFNEDGQMETETEQGCTLVPP